MQARTTLSKGYQLTIPSKARKALGLKAGDDLELDIKHDRIIIKKAQTIAEQINEMVHELDKLNQAYEDRLTPEQKEFNKKTAGWTINQYHEYFDNLPETQTYIKEKFNV